MIVRHRATGLWSAVCLAFLLFSGSTSGAAPPTCPKNDCFVRCFSQSVTQKNSQCIPALDCACQQYAWLCMQKCNCYSDASARTCSDRNTLSCPLPCEGWRAPSATPATGTAAPQAQPLQPQQDRDDGSNQTGQTIALFIICIVLVVGLCFITCEFCIRRIFGNYYWEERMGIMNQYQVAPNTARSGRSSFQDSPRYTHPHTPPPATHAPPVPHQGSGPGTGSSGVGMPNASPRMPLDRDDPY